MKTAELQGAALDLAVGLAMGRKPNDFGWWWDNFKPSANWAHGGPIIEREGVEVQRLPLGEWRAQLNAKGCGPYCRHYGPTPLIAAMRCYVASVLGDTVDIPEELT
jgi:hypothetical protein